MSGSTNSGSQVLELTSMEPSLSAAGEETTAAQGSQSLLAGRKVSTVAYAALAAGILCLGSSALLVKLAGVPGPVSALYRFLLTCLVLIPCWLRSGSRRPAWPQLRLTLAGGVFLGLDIILWNTSIMITTASTASLLGNCAPIWVGLGAWLFFKERLGGRYWFGLAAAFVGMVLVIEVGALFPSHHGRGDILAVVAGILYAGYLLTTQKVRCHVDTLTFMTFSVTAGAVLLLALNLSLGLPLVGYSVRSWSYLLLLTIASQTGGAAVTYALGHLNATVVSVSLLGQVLVTFVLAMPILGEFLNIGQIAGALFILIGIYLVNTRRHSPSLSGSGSG